VLFRLCDLTDIAALETALAEVQHELGPVSVLVNNAGNDDRHGTRDVSAAYFDERVAVNLRHMFFAARGVVDGMIASGRLHREPWLHRLEDGRWRRAVYVTCCAMLPV
jgi:NAD(P)-dependent dehydrogenase (short-subunit alcohol dehydrogenase family)